MSDDFKPPTISQLSRRGFFVAATATAFAPLVGCVRRAPALEEGLDRLEQYPDKIPMLLVNDRPPCLETPWQSFREDFTPNDAFYVRWHLQSIPTYVDPEYWRLHIDGAVQTPLELSMEDLRRMAGDEDEVIAVNQCSGNSRHYAAPRVPGVQWKNGAMGNARWGGISLAKLLRRAGVNKDAVQVVFDGLDEGIPDTVPDFAKALNIDHALQPEVTVAYSMNNQPLPKLNGFPARLVVPGWYATYWVKALRRITVIPSVYDGYWMAKAYKLPVTPNGNEVSNNLSKDLTPISTMNVRSFFTTPDNGAEVAVGKHCALDGIAFDGGSGIRSVEVSTNEGATWSSATLDPDLGRFSFRRWRFLWTPQSRATYRLRVRATSRDGQTQPEIAGWNRSGYMRNVIEELTLRAV